MSPRILPLIVAIAFSLAACRGSGSVEQPPESTSEPMAAAPASKAPTSSSDAGEKGARVKQDSPADAEPSGSSHVDHADATLVETVGVASDSMVTEPTPPPDVEGDEVQAQVHEMLALINKTRQAKGRKKLKLSPGLSAVARAHSQDMVTRGFFEHENPDGHGPGERLGDEAFNYIVTWENLSRNHRTVAGVHRSMTHGYHGKNMLQRTATHVGLGIVAYKRADRGGKMHLMVTQIFGRIRPR